MKDLFPEFYGLEERDIPTLMKEGIIVVDTNVILAVYRSPKEGREALLSSLRKIGERLWIPYQVALEYQRRRLDVIRLEQSRVNDALSKSESKVGDVKEAISGLELDRQGVGIKKEEIAEAFNTFSRFLKDATEKVRSQLPKESFNDPIRKEIDEILAGRVGAAPATQADLDALTRDGSDRYERLIPPGFQDKDKLESFNFRGLKYEAKWGDLILWRQLLSHVQEAKPASVLFVTNDTKSDWWCAERKDGLGPHPDLRTQMRSAGVECFWTLTLSRFIEEAKIHLEPRISDAAVEQVKETAARTVPGIVNFHASNFYKGDMSPTRKAVVRWLSTRGNLLLLDISKSAPKFDFVFQIDGEARGIDIVDVSTHQSGLLSSVLMLLAAEMAVGKMRGAKVKRDIVIVISQEMQGTPELKEFITQAIELGRKFEMDSLYLGWIDGEMFVPRYTWANEARV